MAKKRAPKPLPHKPSGRASVKQRANGEQRLTSYHNDPFLGHYQAVKKAQQVDRAREAWNLFKAGNSMAKIAEHLKVSPFTVWRDLTWLLNLKTSSLALDVTQWREIHNDRLEALVRTHFSKIDKRESADILLRTLERQAKLLNLDLAKADGMVSAQQVMTVLRGAAALFMELVPDPEKRAQWTAGLKRMTGTVIDVTPETKEEE